MLISLNWLKKYVDIDVPVSELTTLIGARLVEIEEAVDIGEKYAGIYVVKVVKASKIEGSDHLSLTFVDDGGIMDSITSRDSDGLVQVVCGAPNVREGMLAVWIAPGATVPTTYGTAEPFVLDTRKLRGYESNGMLAGADELGLTNEHKSIAEIDPEMAKAGDSFADVFGLRDEVILDIENKSLTHRPDCFGIVGFAREVAGILGKEFRTPEWLAESLDETFAGESSLQLGITIEDSRLCPRYEAVILERDDSVGVSDYLTQAQVDLALSGMRSIDKIVDWTNVMMLLTGQPLHAFDYDKLVKVGGKKTPEIIVRAAKKGEKLELLDGKTIEMDENDIVITSSGVPVALAGAMGGANTEIDESTKRIIVESATFSLYNLRKTQMKHGIFSEAITRFTKGQPAELTGYVVREYAKRVAPEYRVISEVFDNYAEKAENPEIELKISDVNGLLGTSYSQGEVRKTLENVGFDILAVGIGEKSPHGGVESAASLTVRAPYWRTDIHIKEDVIEEVGRLNGYDNIPMNLPRRGFEAVEPDAMGDLKAKVREILSGAGANEVWTYNFVHSSLLKKAGQDTENSYQLANSISPDLEYMRQSLTPNLLEKVYENVKADYDKFVLFEINKVHQKIYGVDDEEVPVEKMKVALALANSKSKDENPYYEAKRYVTYLLDKLGVEVEFVTASENHASNAPFEFKRSAQIKDRKTGKCYGICGEYKKSIVRNFKLPEYVAGFELNMDVILALAPKKAFNYKKLSKYPSVGRDVCFKVADGVSFGELAGAVDESLRKSGLNYTVEPIDIYQGEDKATKNVTFHLEFASLEKTLSKDEISAIVDGTTSAIIKELKAEVI